MNKTINHDFMGTKNKTKQFNAIPFSKDLGCGFNLLD